MISVRTTSTQSLLITTSLLSGCTAGEYTEVQGLISTDNDVDIYEFFLEDG